MKSVFHVGFSAASIPAVSVLSRPNGHRNVIRGLSLAVGASRGRSARDLLDSKTRP